MTAIALPNLPVRPVKLAAVSADRPDIVISLRQEGIDTIEIKGAATLPLPTSSHADLQLLHLGNNHLLLADEAIYANDRLMQLGFSTNILVKNLGNIYPHDTSLNFLIMQKYCFGLYSNMPLQLVKYCNYAGLQIINSKQGYARCSVAVVSEKAAITADSTLYKLMSSCGIDVLKIDAGDIVLDGYDTGFIGGCCGLISKDRLAFTGSLNNYAHGEDILQFLKRYNVKPVYLTHGKLCDIGGIIPLMEST